MARRKVLELTACKECPWIRRYETVHVRSISSTGTYVWPYCGHRFGSPHALFDVNTIPMECPLADVDQSHLKAAP